MDMEHNSSASSSSSDHSSESPVTHKRNAGRKKFRETRHPVYRDVRQRKGAKWVCEVRVPNGKSRIWLGTFATPEMAARAYDVAALALRGKAAPVNFPDSAWLLRRAKSSSPCDIRSAAVAAAESFRPTISATPSSSSSSTSPCHSTVTPQRQHVETLSSSTFVDEEPMFNMPAFLDSMAEGLLLTPPSMQQKGYIWDDDVEDYNMDLSLWD